MPDRCHILYVGSQLPKRSETFVYREVLGLRQRGGVTVSVATVHSPDGKLGEKDVDALADEAVQIYPPGKWRLLVDAVKGVSRSRAWRALFQGVTDALFRKDVRRSKRATVVWQCLAGIALAWRVRNRGIHHLHAHMAHVPTTIAMYAASALGVPFSFTGHAVDLFRDRSLLGAKLRRAVRVMCISYWHRRFYQSVAALPDERLPIVRCGVQADAWLPATDATPRVLAVARLVPKKGIAVLIRAIAQLAQQGTAMECTIVGEGPEREGLEQLAKELGVAHHVHFMGSQSNEMVRSLMQTHAIFALPCRIGSDQDRDGIPVVLMEAMACGAAVISGDLPAIRELVEDDVNGLLVPPDDVGALASALQRLHGDASTRRAFGIAARRMVEGEFSLALNLERLEKAFVAPVPMTDQGIPPAVPLATVK